MVRRTVFKGKSNGSRQPALYHNSFHIPWICKCYSCSKTWEIPGCMTITARTIVPLHHYVWCELLRLVLEPDWCWCFRQAGRKISSNAHYHRFEHIVRLLSGQYISHQFLIIKKREDVSYPARRSSRYRIRDSTDSYQRSYHWLAVIGGKCSYPGRETSCTPWSIQIVYGTDNTISLPTKFSLKWLRAVIQETTMPVELVLAVTRLIISQVFWYQ